MKNVTLSRADLVAKLKQNRAAHNEEYLTALTGWHQKVLTALHETSVEFDRTEDTKDLNIGYRFPKPEDHTEDYDRVLEMLEWETQNTITLSQDEFRQLVQDDWDWSRQHRFNSAHYSSS